MAIAQTQAYEQAKSDVTSSNMISFMDMQLKVGHKLHLQLSSRLKNPVEGGARNNPDWLCTRQHFNGYRTRIRSVRRGSSR